MRSYKMRVLRHYRSCSRQLSMLCKQQLADIGVSHAYSDSAVTGLPHPHVHSCGPTPLVCISTVADTSTCTDMSSCHRPLQLLCPGWVALSGFYSSCRSFLSEGPATASSTGRERLCLSFCLPIVEMEPACSPAAERLASIAFPAISKASFVAAGRTPSWPPAPSGKSTSTSHSQPSSPTSGIEP